MRRFNYIYLLFFTVLVFSSSGCREIKKESDESYLDERFPQLEEQRNAREHPPTFEELEAKITDENPQIRADAITALSEFTYEPHPELFDKLLEIIEQDDSNIVRAAALGTLAAQDNVTHFVLDEDTAPDFLKYANDDDAVVRKAAIASLPYLVDVAYPQTMDCSSETDEDIQRLISQHPAVPLILPTIYNALDDPDPGVVLAAIEAVNGLTPFSVDAVSSLIKLLDSENEDIQVASLVALDELPKVPKSITPKLAEFIEGGGNEELAALNLVCHVFQPGPEIESALIGALKDEEPGIRSQALTAIGCVPREYKNRAMLDGVAGLLDDTTELGNWMMTESPMQVRTRAVWILESFRHDAIIYAPELIPLLRVDNIETRYHTAHALGWIGPSPEIIDALIETLNDKSPRVQETAAYSLGSFGEASTRALLALEALLKEQSPESQGLTLAAIRMIKGESPTPLEILEDRE